MGKSKSGDPIGMAASMQDMMYKNKAAIPNQNDVNASLFEDIGNNSFKRPGDRPRGILNNLGEGISKGLAYGEKSKAAQSRRGEYDKYEQVMNYFQEANNSAIEKLKFHQEREAEMEAVRPYAVGGLEVSYSGMPYDQGNERMRNLVEQAKLNNPKIKGDYIGYVPNSPIVNMRDENGNITALSLSSIAGEDVVKRIQGDYIDRQKLSQGSEKLAIEKEYAPQKYEVMQQRIDQTSRRNDLNDTKSDIKLNETLGKKIDASREFLTIAPKMEKIVREHPDIFQSAMDATWRENDEPGYVNNAIKAAQNKWDPEKVAALTSMIKYINKMTLDVANGFARPNMFIEKIGSKAVPNLDMTPQAFSEILHEMVDEKRKDIENNQRRMELFERQKEKPLSQDYQKSTAEVMGGHEAPWAALWKESP